MKKLFAIAFAVIMCAIVALIVKKFVGADSFFTQPDASSGFQVLRIKDGTQIVEAETFPDLTWKVSQYAVIESKDGFTEELQSETPFQNREDVAQHLGDLGYPLFDLAEYIDNETEERLTDCTESENGIWRDNRAEIEVNVLVPRNLGGYKSIACSVDLKNKFIIFKASPEPEIIIYEVKAKKWPTTDYEDSQEFTIHFQTSAGAMQFYRTLWHKF